MDFTTFAGVCLVFALTLNHIMMDLNLANETGPGDSSSSETMLYIGLLLNIFKNVGVEYNVVIKYIII